MDQDTNDNDEGVNQRVLLIVALRPHIPTKVLIMDVLSILY